MPGKLQTSHKTFSAQKTIDTHYKAKSSIRNQKIQNVIKRIKILDASKNPNATKKRKLLNDGKKAKI